MEWNEITILHKTGCCNIRLATVDDFAPTADSLDGFERTISSSYICIPAN